MWYTVAKPKSTNGEPLFPQRKEGVMYAWSTSRVLLSLVLIAVFAGAALAASPGDVVINELYVNTADYFDGSEYIELYNTTGDSIDLDGWVLSSVEYDETCGEHHHELPETTWIEPYGYVIIARDVATADNNGFEDRFGFLPDLEMYDASQTLYEVDDARVRNTTCQNPDAYDDQIRLYPGTSDYAYRCPVVGRYEVLFLYDTPSRTNLIDAVEYSDSYCTQDMCAGVNGTNDAYRRYPDEGISLGRDDMGSDTDNSAVDLHEAAPTPRAQNAMTLPPRVWTLRYSPCVPEPLTDNIEISCYAADDDGTIASVVCYCDIDSTGTYTPYPMTAAPGDSFYTCTISPQADQSHGVFYVIATDNLAASTTYPGDAPQGAYRFSVGLTQISVIQGTFRPTAEDSTSSFYTGQAKNITGVVTAGRGEFYNDGVFVVQQGFGNYAGIHVYDATYSVPAERGDEVVLSGLVTEYNGLTELRLFTGCYEEIGSGAALPAPLVITTNSLNTATAGSERYEGVFVRTENVTVTNDSLGFGEWEINDGTGPCRVNDDGTYFYTPRSGDVLQAVQGIGNYTFDDFKMEPRDDEDISGPPVIYNLVYSPHAPTNTEQMTFSCTSYGANTITSVKLFYSITGGAPFDSLSMTTPGDSVYSVGGIGPYPDDTVVDYYVEVWDDAAYSSRKPTAGTYDLRVGMKTIYQVQFNRGADGDSSALAGEPVNLSGIVTAAIGEFSDYYFYVQNSYFGGDTPAFDGVKVYDRTGTVSVARGDSITISGDVWEYYNETEIAMFFPEAITVHSTGNDVPAPYVVSPTSVDTSEDWEGVLVGATDVVVSDPDLGFGEWMIAANGSPADSCRVGDDAYYTYNPLLGESLAYVYGLGTYAFGLRMLQPRDDDDICAASEAGIEDPARATKLMMMVKPNPMMSGGTVRFSIPASDRVSLKIYNVQGELVKTLVDRSIEAGSHKIDWNATNNRGSRVTSGIYFVRLDTRKGSLVNKVVVSR
jgi:hypothetical protein